MTIEIKKSDKKALPSIELNQKSMDQGYHARLIWQSLFRVYRQKVENLDEMHDMLCDVYTIERYLKGTHESKIVFWWECSKTYTGRGVTDISDYNPTFKDSIRVEYDAEAKTIEFFHEPSRY